MQFKVPQFLDIEDKIFGPFTFRQFVYLAGGAGLCFVLYRLLGLLWSSLPILFVGGFAGALTFYRPNNKPFINMLEAGIKYLFQSKLYIWERRMGQAGQARDSKQEALTAAQTSSATQVGARLTGEKLRDLAWSLDVLDLSREKKN